MINFLTKIGYFLWWTCNQLYAFPGKLYTLFCHLFRMSASFSDPVVLINAPIIVTIVGIIFMAIFESVDHLINLRKSLGTDQSCSSDYKLVSTKVINDGFHTYTQSCYIGPDKDDK